LEVSSLAPESLWDFVVTLAAVWAGIGAGVAVAVVGNRLGHEADMQTTIVKIIP